MWDAKRPYYHAKRGALARIRTRNAWFEAKYDIQFHHEGIIIYLNYIKFIGKYQFLIYTKPRPKRFASGGVFTKYFKVKL